MPHVIVIADDDPTSRQVLAGILDGQGYELLVAEDAAGVKAIFAERDDVELLVSDHWMPRQTGYDLILELSATHPDLKTILYSGGKDGIRSGKMRMWFEGCGVTHTLVKPFMAHEVLETVQAALATVCSE